MSSVLFLDQALADGVSRGMVVVSVDEFVVVAAEIPTTVRAELGRLFDATPLMLFQLIGAAESADIAYLDLLTGLG